ncbi:hypothetical protein [Mesorhizobium sp.]|uniref:hypothetical protein n=1 Tax=Mesorhizobium sp. TaxID=1871066 RepID=UPI0025C509C5|nr:hypothetical protein [Mesorhizobium sp.]
MRLLAVLPNGLTGSLGVLAFGGLSAGTLAGLILTALVLASGVLLAVQKRRFVRVGRGLALGRGFTLRGLGRLFASGRLLAGCGLFFRHRLLADKFLAKLLLVLRLFALGGSCLLLGGHGKRFSLRDRLAGCRLFGRRLLGGRSLDLLILLALLLAQIVLPIVVVCRRDLV